MKNLQDKRRKGLIERGDCFLLGEHILACGDARDGQLLKKILKGGEVKVVAVDVPYGVGYTESKEGFQKISRAKAIANDHIQGDEEYRKFTSEWIEAIKPHLARKNAFYIFNSDKMVFALREGMKDAGCCLAQLLIWVKTHSIIGRKDFLPQHELIAYGWVGTHEFLKSKDKSVIVYPKPSKSKYHPTMKPLGLMRHLILNSSRVGDIIYDGFLGSGTTLLACEQTRRKCVGVELDPEYCQTIIDRFEKMTGIKAIKINEK